MTPGGLAGATDQELVRPGRASVAHDCPTRGRLDRSFNARALVGRLRCVVGTRLFNGRASARAIVFDGDDTLWSTEELYDSARARAAALVASAGLDAAEWERIERELDVKSVETHGFSPERFPRSCVMAYEAVCEREGRAIDADLLEAIRDAARSVFSARPRLKPGAASVLQRLRKHGYLLALLTKGAHDVQWSRIEASGLKPHFDVVSVVESKSPEDVLEVLSRLGVESRNAWMVGNSVRSDILPALEAGLRVAWIDAHVWEHERSHDHLVDERVLVCNNLSEFSAHLVAA